MGTKEAKNDFGRPLLPAALEELDAARRGALRLVGIRGRFRGIHEDRSRREGDRGARWVGSQSLTGEPRCCSSVSPGARFPRGAQGLLGPGIVNVRVVSKKIIRRCSKCCCKRSEDRDVGQRLTALPL